jgi:hypothetical protein
MFYKKLDMLMKITGTKNSALAMQTSLDASHISRLRRGERRLVQDADYVKAMASYFSRQLGEDYRRRLVAEAMQKPMELLVDQEALAGVIHTWLIDDKDGGQESIIRFLDGFSANIGSQQMELDCAADVSDTLPKEEMECHYGKQGKRDAVMGFLTQLLQSEKPTTLLLYSDEDMDWLSEDYQFAREWACLLKQVIAQGNMIKIIHTVSRNLDDMLEGLSKWMPLYMTGAIQPYYYPRKRDGIFKRTLFIAEGRVAMTTSSVGDSLDHSLNILLRNPKAVAALEAEFYGYLDLCKPLMRIIGESQKQERQQLWNEFAEVQADQVMITSRMPVYSMSEGLQKRMAEHSGIIYDNMHAYQVDAPRRFEQNLSQNRVWEMVRLPDVTSIRRGQAPSDLSKGDGEMVCYHPHEFVEHLDNMIRLLQEYDNYNIIIEKKQYAEDYNLIIKEHFGAIIERTANPQVLFQVSESNMIAAFWDYFRLVALPAAKEKTETIEELKALITELQ